MTIIKRSALVAWGRNPPPDLHSIVADHSGQRIVTWSDVMQRRRERQAEELRGKRYVREWRAYKLWVAYFDQDFYGGWHAFVKNVHEQIWTFRGGPRESDLMELFPLVLPNLPDRWERWMVEFATVYQRGTHHRRPRGVAYIWWNGRDKPRLTKPTEAA